MDKIADAFRNLDDVNSDVYRAFEKSRVKWEEIFRRHIDAISESERLTEEDFAIRITTQEAPVQAVRMSFFREIEQLTEPADGGQP